LWSAAERLSLLLAAAYLAAALHGLGAADIVGDDEAREAGIVQDVAAGHWLWPRFNGELLPDKPLLYHWLAAVPCVAGGFSETAVRLPSALAGAALVGLVATLGADLLGPPVGLVAAALLATMPALFAHARVARPDVLLVLLLSAALGLAFRAWRDGRRRDASGALAVLGAATLAKGPVAPVLFALTIGGFLAWQRDLRRLRRLVTGPGLAAFLVLGLGWYAVALGGWRETFVREHLLGRYLRNLVGGLAAGGSYSPRPLSYHVLFYVKHLPAVALPWTPFVVLALVQAWRTSGLADPRLRFLLCWAAAPVIAFTPAEWKLRYYLLPSLPPLALLAAPTVLDLWRGTPRRLAFPALLPLAAAVVLATAFAAWAAASGLLALSRSDRTTLAALVALAPGGAPAAVAGIGFAAGALLVAIARRAWPVVIGVLAVGAALWMVAGEPALAQAISARDSLKPFAEAVATRYPPPAPLVFYGDPIRSVAVYVGRQVPSARRPRRIGPRTAVIATEPAYEEIAEAGLVGPALLVAEGRVGNEARGRVVLAERLPTP